MRWDKVAELYTAETAVNDEGDHYELDKDHSVVFANSRNMGLETWAAARSYGLHADASVQVRSQEYAGQNRCIIDEVEYEVERSYDTGEYTTLTLKRRLSNVSA